MGLNAVKILEISITTNSKKEILEYIQKYLEKNLQFARKPLIIVTPNSEQMVLGHNNKHFAQILNRADIAIPDGIGVVWASKGKVQERIPGVELVEDLAKLASRERAPIGLIGGRDKVAAEALECLRQKCPGLSGWVQEQADVFALAKKIKQHDTRIVFVGMGAPKQEFLIEKLSHQLLNEEVILMAVGGSFDIIAGKVKRAPLVIRSIGFEWLWRLVREPWRWKRQLAILKFVWLVLRQSVQIPQREAREKTVF